MLARQETERYLRHILLKEVGAQGQQMLRAARVLVVGAGGLGAPVLQYLAAAGVGRIGIADDDAVALSNLQRQVLFATADVGAPKTAAAAAFLARLNPDVAITEHRLRVDAGNAADLVGGYDVVVEGVDGFATRFVLNAVCMRAKKPLISAAIGRFEGQLSVFKPYAGDLPCYRCFVADAPPRGARVNCAEEGVLGPVAGVMGALAALETIKEILGLGRSLAGRLLVYEALDSEFRTIALPRDPSCPDCFELPRAKPAISPSASGR